MHMPGGGSPLFCVPIQQHPGGPQYILSNGGRDVTSAFVALHPAGTLKKSLREDQLVGDIDPAAKVPRVNFSPEEVSERREALPELETIVNLNQFEEHAQYVLGDDSIPWRYFSVRSDGSNRPPLPLS